MLLIFVVASASVWWFYFRTPPLLGFALGNGRLEADEVDVATKFFGRVSEILVDEGDKVDAGQIVARMDTKSLEATLREANAMAVKAKKQRSYARSVLTQRDIECSLAEKNLKRSKELYEKKIISLERLDRDETEYKAAEARFDAAQAEVENAEATIEAALAEIEKLEADIEDSILTTPISGRVQYRMAEPGEVLAAGGKLLTIIDLADIHMSLFLPTDEVGKVEIGAEARIVLDYAPEYGIPATVYYVADRAQFTPKEVETATERQKLAFRVKVRIDPSFLRKNESWIKVGIPGIAYIRLDRDAPWPENLDNIPDMTNEPTDTKS